MEAGQESQLTPRVHLGERAGRAHAVWPVALALAAGLALRLWLLRSLFEVNGDSLIYGGLAKNLLLHGRFDLTLPSGEMYPTLIRLPGYPIFLAVCFRLFGMENYYAAACVQIALDLLGCLLLAGFVRRIAPSSVSRGAALATLWLAALCPFTACYTLEPLTETPTLFVLALAMWAMARFRDEPNWPNALWFTAAVTCATLLRPDGALAAIAFAPALFPGLVRDRGRASVPLRKDFPGLGAGLRETGISARKFFPGLGIGLREAETSARKLWQMAAVCVLLALAPFAVWTARNWSVFHVFEPLAPRLANDPGDFSPLGWERWVKSWCLDFASTFEIYWSEPGEKLDLGKLPSRAFDSPAQFAETASLFAAYEDDGEDISPGLDARFERLAEERIAAHPVRYYLWLPVGRVTDMWLRPRVENLPIDLDWWVYSHHRAETEFSWAYAGLNLLYLLLGIGGLCMRPRFWGALLVYVLMRSALLFTVSAPETRYTLECFPMLFAGGGIAFSWLAQRSHWPATKLKAPLGNG